VTGCRVATSHTRAASSSETTSIRRPSGLNVTSDTSLSAVTGGPESWPVAASQTCTILPPHVSAYRPSGLNEALRTPPGWRSTGPIGWPVAASQSLTSGRSFHETSTGRTPPRPRKSFPQGRGANEPTAPAAYIETHIEPNPDSRGFSPIVST